MLVWLWLNNTAWESVILAISNSFCVVMYFNPLRFKKLKLKTHLWLEKIHQTFSYGTKYIICNEPVATGVLPKYAEEYKWLHYLYKLQFTDCNTEVLLPCRLMSCWVWREQLNSKTQSLVLHSREWKPGCPIYPEVAASISLWPLTFIALRLANLSVQRLKKSGKGNKEGLYWEWCSWTAGALSDIRNLYNHLDIKSCEWRFISQNGVKCSMVWVRYFILGK